MTLSERIAEARKQYPADKWDLIFDESGCLMGAALKPAPNKSEAEHGFR